MKRFVCPRCNEERILCNAVAYVAVDPNRLDWVKVLELKDLEIDDNADAWCVCCDWNGKVKELKEVKK